MKTKLIGVVSRTQWLLCCALVWLAAPARAYPPPSTSMPDPPAIKLPDAEDSPAPAHSDIDATDANADANGESKIIIETPDPDSEMGTKKEVAWLGVSTEEASEALASQLGLQPGEGLLVVYVATNSPASAIGLQKNDLLVEFDGQMLVHPSQLRKLVRMHKDGDKVKLTYMRGGKKEEATAILALTKASFGLMGDPETWGNLAHTPQMEELQKQIHELTSGETVHAIKEALAKAGVDRDKLQLQIHKGMEEAHRAMAEAMAQQAHAQASYKSATKMLEDMAHHGVQVDKDATVTITSRQNKTILKADETGTYVIVANPQKRLTAHDKDGKLLFDGEIETPEDQAKVPPEVWKQVMPMIEKLENTGKSTPGAGEAPKKRTSTHREHASPPGFNSTAANLRTFVAMVRFLLEPDSAPAAVDTQGAMAAASRFLFLRTL